jgi:hypothetical protein
MIGGRRRGLSCPCRNGSSKECARKQRCREKEVFHFRLLLHFHTAGSSRATSSSSFERSPRRLRWRWGRGRQRLTDGEPHGSDLLLLGNDDLLHQPSNLRVATVAKHSECHVDCTLVVRHHHCYEIDIDVPRRLHCHVLHHFFHGRRTSSKVRSLASRGSVLVCAIATNVIFRPAALARADFRRDRRRIRACSLRAVRQS